MKLKELFDDKTIKQKEKVESISKLLLDKELSIEELITFAKTAADIPKGSCIEALEFATKQDTSIGTEKCLQFVTQTLMDKAPRIKWESAKVIGNIAHLFPSKLNKVIVHLLMNTNDKGTVVRWASAFAIGEIVKLKTKHNTDLVPAIEVICLNEENNAIKKKYLDAIKKSKK
jgi:HEAT repeat protein